MEQIASRAWKTSYLFAQNASKASPRASAATCASSAAPSGVPCARLSPWTTFQFRLRRSSAKSSAATDWLHPTRQRQLGNATAIYVTGGSLEELSPIFEKLREDADQEFLIERLEMPFGIYGRFRDNYEVKWCFGGAYRADDRASPPVSIPIIKK